MFGDVWDVYTPQDFKGDERAILFIQVGRKKANTHLYIFSPDAPNVENIYLHEFGEKWPLEQGEM